MSSKKARFSSLVALSMARRLGLLLAVSRFLNLTNGQGKVIFKVNFDLAAARQNDSSSPSPFCGKLTSFARALLLCQLET